MRAVLLCVLLLIGCVACDLAIPTLTSDIVDVGIQQSGVDHVSVEEMSASTHEAIAKSLPADDDRLFEGAYEQADDGIWHMTEEGYAHRSELDQLIAGPLVSIHFPDKAGAFEKGPSELIGQQAVAAALKEYSGLGVDLQGKQMSYLVGTGALMVGIAALSMVLNILVGLIAARTGSTIGRDLRRGLFSKVVSFSDAEISEFSAASLITRGTNDIQLIQNVTIMILRMVLYAPIVAIGGIVMVLYTDASLGWIIVVAVAVVALVIGVLFKVTGPKFKIMQPLIDKVNLIAREMLTGLPVIRAFGRQAYEQERFDEASVRLMKTQLFTNRAMSFMMPTMMLVMNLTSVAIVWFGGHYIQEGLIQTGDMIAFITYSMVIIMGFLMIGMISIMLPRADVAAERVQEVLSCECVVQDPDEPQCMEAEERGASIEFKNVSFRYPGSEGCALEDVSFKVEPGQTVGIIGGTGSGKSTILKLMERFYDTCSGSVIVNGADVKDVRQSELRQTFGYVPQRSFLFSGTVDTNVAYSDESMTEANVERAVRIAQAQGFVSDRPEGMDSSIAQGGQNISGGQRQRLCIARAIASDAKAYLFDDSFSALDYKTDSRLCHALDEELAGATKVIVAQRISSIRNADKIVVMKDGRVAGFGTHDELMDDCETYSHIALSQLTEAELAMGGDA